MKTEEFLTKRAAVLSHLNEALALAREIRDGHEEPRVRAWWAEKVIPHIAAADNSIP